jgi:hypothetical protein
MERLRGDGGWRGASVRASCGLVSRLVPRRAVLERMNKMLYTSVGTPY